VFPTDAGSDDQVRGRRPILQHFDVMDFYRARDLLDGAIEKAVQPPTFARELSKIPQNTDVPANRLQLGAATLLDIHFRGHNRSPPDCRLDIERQRRTAITKPFDATCKRTLLPRTVAAAGRKSAAPSLVQRAKYPRMQRSVGACKEESH
jgi:hypothetical protein